jgi:type I restriction enzyme M protein
MVASMKPEMGRVGVVMPHGVLFRGGAEKQIRQGLVQSDLLEAVIGLPPNLFYSTNIPACLLIFRAAKSASRSGAVLFVDGSAQFIKGKNQNHLRVEGIKAIVTAYRSAQAVEGDGRVPARLVEHAEIKEQGWDLNFARYLTASIAQGTDVVAALAELAEAQRQLREAEQQLAERLKAAGYA